MRRVGSALRQRYGRAGMNPFAPQPRVRFESRWNLGDPGAVYEFNVKIYRLESDASEGDWYHEVQSALEDFQTAVHKKYPWVGDVHFTGRSGGWLAVEDPDGRMTRAKLEAIGKLVGAGLSRFKKHMVSEYPRSE
jgi:hypothetical protein